VHREEICRTHWFMFYNKLKKYIYIFLGIKNNMIVVKTWRRTISYSNLYPVLNYSYSRMFAISWSKISWNRDLLRYDHPLKYIILYRWRGRRIARNRGCHNIIYAKFLTISYLLVFTLQCTVHFFFYGRSIEQCTNVFQFLNSKYIIRIMYNWYFKSEDCILNFHMFTISNTFKSFSYTIFMVIRILEYFFVNYRLFKCEPYLLYYYNIYAESVKLYQTRSDRYTKFLIAIQCSIDKHTLPAYALHSWYYPVIYKLGTYSLLQFCINNNNNNILI
jgi:hypothetical protein